MIKNTLGHMAQHAGAPAEFAKPSPKWVQHITARVTRIMEMAATLPSLPQAQRPVKDKEVRQEAVNVMHLTHHFMVVNHGPSPELSDALRPLVVSGLRPDRPSTMLAALLPETCLPQLTECTLGGDLLKLKDLSQIAQSVSGAQAADVRRKLGDLALNAITPEFADQVISVLADIDARKAKNSLDTLPVDMHGGAPLLRATSRFPSLVTGLSQTKPVQRPKSPGLKAFAFRKGAQTAPAKIPMPSIDAALAVSLQSVDSQASGSSTASTFITRVPMAEGNKEPLTPKTYDRDGKLQKPRLSMVTHTGDLEIGPLVITHTLFRGSMGKVSFGMDSNARSYALKLFHIYNPDLPVYNNMSYGEIMALHRASTHLAVKSAVVQEAEDTQFYRDNLNNFTARYDAPDRPHNDSLRAVRRGIYQFQVYGIIELPERNGVQKMIMVMDREDGDLVTLTEAIDAKHHPALCLSAASQLYSECEGLHGALLKAHFDLKMENVLFTRSGQILTADFGYTQSIAKAGRKIAHSPMFGTLLTPEHIVAINTAAPNQRAFTAGTDVFALALTIASLAAKQLPPFALTHFITNGAFDEGAAARFMTDFYAYRDSLFVEGKMTADSAPTSGTLGTFFGPLAQAHPALFDLLMEHALNPDPVQRWPASRLAREARRLLAAPDAPDFDAMIEEMNAIAKSDSGLQTLIQGARAQFRPDEA